MSVTVVIGGSNEVIFKSGVSVRPSSVVGFSTTWELVWEPSGGGAALVSVNIVTVGSLEAVLRSGATAGP